MKQEEIYESWINGQKKQAAEQFENLNPREKETFLDDLKLGFFGQVEAIEFLCYLVNRKY